MARITRNNKLVPCQFCGKEFASTGIKMHERNCPEKPEDWEEGAEEFDSEDDDNDSPEEHDSNEETPVENVRASTVPKGGNLTMLGVEKHTIFYFSNYYNVNQGVPIELPTELAKELLRKGIVEPL